MSDYVSKMNAKKEDDGFDEGLEKLYLEKFKLWLGSASRALQNKRLKEESYHGENGSLEHE